MPGLGQAGLPLINALQNQGTLLVLGALLGPVAVAIFQTTRVLSNGVKSVIGLLSGAIGVEIPALSSERTQQNHSKTPNSQHTGGPSSCRWRVHLFVPIWKNHFPVVATTGTCIFANTDSTSLCISDSICARKLFQHPAYSGKPDSPGDRINSGSGGRFTITDCSRCAPVWLAGCRCRRDCV